MNFSLWSPAVICRGVQPDSRSPSAGEHCEEGRSFPSADHEPKADQAAVLHGRQLSKSQITLCQREGRTPTLLFSGDAKFGNVKMYQGFHLHKSLLKFLEMVHLKCVFCHYLLSIMLFQNLALNHTMKVDLYLVKERNKQVWKEQIRVSKYLQNFWVNSPFNSDVLKSRTHPSFKCECIYSVILLHMLSCSFKNTTSKDLNQFNWKFTCPSYFLLLLTSYCRHTVFFSFFFFLSTFMVNEWTKFWWLKYTTIKTFTLCILGAFFFWPLSLVMHSCFIIFFFILWIKPYMYP